MSLITLRQLLDCAAEDNYGIPAFNVNNMEQVLAILAAADKTQSPVIIQASKGARAYANDAVLKHLMLAAVEMYPRLPICVHQDHGPTPDVCFSAIANGFTSVMMDGSLTPDGKPASYDYNVSTTRQVVDAAHQVGVSVEGELGCIGSLETGKGDKEDGHGFDGAISKKQLLTDPDEAVAFVKATKVDALAVAIGTSHGAYKFTRKPDGAVLSIETIKRIHAKLPNTHLVMHGSSSVPQDLQKSPAIKFTQSQSQKAESKKSLQSLPLYSICLVVAVKILDNWKLWSWGKYKGDICARKRMLYCTRLLDVLFA